MQNFILNISHSGYGAFGLILYLYINMIYEIVNNILLKRANQITNYSLGFVYSIISAYFLSFLGKVGSIIIIFLMFLYSIKLIKEKRYLVRISDIGFTLLIGLILGTFFHSANNNINSGIIPGDVYSYASWFSSLLEYPNQFRELVINEVKFGNIFAIAGNGILVIGSSLFRLIDINPINFISITLPVTGLILLKKSSEEFLNLGNTDRFLYIFNQSSIIVFLIVLALLPYPYFVVESPSTLIGLALLLNAAKLIFRNKISSIQDVFSYFLYMYAFYSSKLAVSPSIFIKSLIQNKRNFYFSIIPVTLFVIILFYKHSDFISILFSPNFSIVNILKVILIISYLFFTGFNYIDLIVVISSSLIFIFSYSIFGSIISGCALMLNSFKNKQNINLQNKNLFKYLLIFLAIISIYLSFPNMKVFIMNLLIIISSISYLSFKETSFLKSYYLSFKKLQILKINYFFILFIPLFIITSIISKPYEGKNLLNTVNSFDSYDYITYKKIRDLTKKSSLIFIDNFDGLNLSSLGRRQFYISGWQNTKLRNNKNKISELVEINNKITNLDEESCKFARDISKNDLYIIRKIKKDKIKIANSDHKRIYLNKKYEIFKLC